MKQLEIGVFLGSLRRDAYSRKMAAAVSALMPPEFQMELMPIDTLPLFNQDYDDDGAVPDSWQALRKTVAQLDGFLMITPEYNRSIPPVLKNAVDIASRPHGHNLWTRKPGAILSISPGKIGGYGAHQHLRQCLTSLNATLMQYPETYFSQVQNLFDEEGTVTDLDNAAFLQRVSTAFAHWIQKNLS